MKQEYSYGAVVYQIKEGKTLVLVEHMALGHTSIPKGHIEEGETEEECALREIREETNLEVNLDTSFRHTVTYSPKEGVMKDVTFFLATPKTESMIPQLCEVSSLEWLEIEKAIQAMTFDTDKETLSLAWEKLRKNA
jgi:bis(5'-nucleosidyl)-tetraphosphatase